MGLAQTNTNRDTPPNNIWKLIGRPMNATSISAAKSFRWLAKAARTAIFV